LERLFRCAVGNDFAQRVFKEREGVFDLAVGQGVGAVLGLTDDAQITAVLLVEAHKGLVHPRQMRRSSVDRGEEHACKQCAHAELSGPHPDGEQCLEAPWHPRGVDNGQKARQCCRIVHLLPPKLSFKP